MCKYASMPGNFVKRCDVLNRAVKKIWAHGICDIFICFRTTLYYFILPMLILSSVVHRFIILEIISNCGVLTNAALVTFTGSIMINQTWMMRVWTFIMMVAFVLGAKVSMSISHTFLYIARF